MGFDVNSIVVNDTHDLKIKHPTTGKNTGMVVTVYGKDSATFLAANRKQKMKFLEDVERDPKLVADAVGYEFIADCVAGWSGVSENDEELPFTRENLIRVCKQHKWLFDQIDQTIIKRKLFIKG